MKQANILVIWYTPENWQRAPTGNSSSNHWFSELLLLVSGGVFLLMTLLRMVKFKWPELKGCLTSSPIGDLNGHLEHSCFALQNSSSTRIQSPYQMGGPITSETQGDVRCHFLSQEVIGSLGGKCQKVHQVRWMDLGITISLYIYLLICLVPMCPLFYCKWKSTQNNRLFNLTPPNLPSPEIRPY